MPAWSTPLLCPLWCTATSRSLSKTVRSTPGSTLSNSRATARPTMPAPMTQTEALALGPLTRRSSSPDLAGHDRVRRSGPDGSHRHHPVRRGTTVSHMGITRMNHAVLYVRSADRTAEFYERVLGFTRIIKDPNNR